MLLPLSTKYLLALSKQTDHGVYEAQTAFNHNTNIYQCWPATFLRVSVVTDWLWFSKQCFLSAFFTCSSFWFLILYLGNGFLSRSLSFWLPFFLTPFLFRSLFYISAKLQSNTTNTSLSACKLKIISILFQSNQLICGFLDSTILRVNFDRYFLDLASHQFKLILISIWKKNALHGFYINV